MKAYLEQTRSLAFSLIAIAPLILFYELFIVNFNGTAIRNAAEKLIKDALAQTGLIFLWQLALVYLAITLVIVFYSMHKKQFQFPRPAYWGGLVIESLFYATFFGVGTRYLTQIVLSLQAAADYGEPAIFHEILLAIAAGVYEEILFRLILLGSILFIFRKIWPTKPIIHAAVASAIAASIFAIFHYPGIVAVTWDSFMFRLIAGWLLGLLFIYRGLAVTVYTHAFYDILYILNAI
ncbi:MAG: CPBP family glutamic-type intramembrane protease [candidate division KSB1 bacterium]|nr:CPBP family glutamic-type intramembrane protease [candidate division KSB1 bacterium]MDQ7062746.1 CPBP family glutamic-type intramembrane protease [candidate division KSB1 bacterium]